MTKLDDIYNRGMEKFNDFYTERKPEKRSRKPKQCRYPGCTTVILLKPLTHPYCPEHDKLIESKRIYETDGVGVVGRPVKPPEEAQKHVPIR